MLTALVTAAIIAQAQPGWGVAAIVEPARESLRYRFDNPSSFNTEELVPHFFEQTYDTRNVWIGVAVTYSLWGGASQTRASFTPGATRRADDFDTFFQPDGNVIVAGTTGNASIWSWQLGQRVSTGRLLGSSVGVALGYRRDTARYHEGIGIVRTSNPPTEERRTVTTREFVTSQLFEAGMFATRNWSSFSAGVEVVGVGVGRLAVQLPDKYPGQTIVASGRYSAATIEVAYAWTAGPSVVRAGLRTGASLPWQRSSAMYLRRLSLLLSIGTRH